MDANSTITTAPQACTVDEMVGAIAAELRDIELDVLTSYTLADAIREGASVTRQRFGAWIGTGEACALGAAFLAAKARGYTS